MSTAIARFTCVGQSAFFCSLMLLLATAPPPLQAQAFREVDSQARESQPSAFAPLVRVITTTIEPDSWDEVGGAGSLESVDGWGLVIVSQTSDVHSQIADLIAVLRRARQMQEGQPKPKSAPNKSAKQVSLVVESDRAMAVRTKIESALEVETSLEFNETPLSDVVEFIKTKHKIPVYVDSRSLEEVGLDTTTAVTIQLKGVSLRSGLRLMLNSIGLTTVIRDDVLKITTPERAESELITRVYAVKDLAIPSQGKSKQ